jgi:hypothetical protein
LSLKHSIAPRQGFPKTKQRLAGCIQSTNNSKPALPSTKINLFKIMFITNPYCMHYSLCMMYRMSNIAGIYGTYCHVWLHLWMDIWSVKNIVLKTDIGGTKLRVHGQHIMGHFAICAWKLMCSGYGYNLQSSKERKFELFEVCS